MAKRKTDKRAKRAKLDKPKIDVAPKFHDRLFGHVFFEPGVNWFKSDKFASSMDLGIVFIAQTIEDARTLVQMAKPFWRERTKWFAEFRQIVEDREYEATASRADWDAKQGHGERVTRKRFRQLLGRNPCLVTFYNDNGKLLFRLTAHDEVLFGDHTVDVEGSFPDGLIED